MRRKSSLLIAVIPLFIFACTQNETPTVPTISPVPSPPAAINRTVTPDAVQIAQATGTPDIEATVVSAVRATVSAALTATATTAPTPTATATPTPTPTTTATAAPEPTATATVAPEPTATATVAPEPTATATAAPAPTATATAAPAPTATATAAPAPTATATSAPAPTATAVPAPEPTATATLAPEPTATTMPAPPPQIEAQYQVSIQNVDLAEEVVVIVNSGASPQVMTGWELLSQEGGQRFVFPRFTLNSGAAVRVTSGPNGRQDPPGVLQWLKSDGSPYRGHVWNNDGDVAILFDSRGNEVSRFPQT